MRSNNIMFENLRAEMARKQITIKGIAKEIGVNRDTLGNKLSGKRPLHLDEALLMNRIFFPEKDVVYLFKEICSYETLKH
ncbi:helix-turn-helix transcriptional regulator [Clostridium sp.]|uniref:helix-turn-helix domain-containing protein n=1 Tax=Clostridium sp. TaxID=1506 RepID=UPI001A530FC5|nr:helix-turn-helix transcriptional regulator [Clostridium sp.]MBK5237444.1 helix-turn-helix transcriptional regulator [Clostridium sp.]